MVSLDRFREALPGVEDTELDELRTSLYLLAQLAIEDLVARGVPGASKTKEAIADVDHPHPQELEPLPIHAYPEYG